MTYQSIGGVDTRDYNQNVFTNTIAQDDVRLVRQPQHAQRAASRPARVHAAQLFRRRHDRLVLDHAERQRRHRPVQRPDVQRPAGRDLGAGAGLGGDADVGRRPAGGGRTASPACPLRADRRAPSWLRCRTTCPAGRCRSAARRWRDARPDRWRAPAGGAGSSAPSARRRARRARRASSARRASCRRRRRCRTGPATGPAPASSGVFTRSNFTSIFLSSSAFCCQACESAKRPR